MLSSTGKVLGTFFTVLLLATLANAQGGTCKICQQVTVDCGDYIQEGGRCAADSINGAAIFCSISYGMCNNGKTYTGCVNTPLGEPSPECGFQLTLLERVKESDYYALQLRIPNCKGGYTMPAVRSSKVPKRKENNV